MGLPRFTLAPGLLDGFNPCAMWVLLFQRSMPVRLCDRGRVALVAGTFVAVSGAVMLGLGQTLLVAPRWLFRCRALDRRRQRALERSPAMPPPGTAAGQVIVKLRLKRRGARPCRSPPARPWPAR
jgi:hypothetical protein